MLVKVTPWLATLAAVGMLIAAIGGGSWWAAGYAVYAALMTWFWASAQAALGSDP